MCMMGVTVMVPRSDADSDDCRRPSDGELESAHDPPLKLSPELIAGIVKQVEFYFSDANLATDRKLCKHIFKGPRGSVPVKLFANFRKVRAITKDAATISAALRSSTALSLSEDGTLVGRIAPMPEVDVDNIQRRTIVVENLPPHPHPTIESVTNMFLVYGKVNIVRICSKESKGRLPHWLTATTRTLQHQHHAFVEFCDVDSAILAVAALHEADGWGSAVKVRHLLLAASDENGNIKPIPVWEPPAHRPATVSPRGVGRGGTSHVNVLVRGGSGSHSSVCSSSHGMSRKWDSIVSPCTPAGRPSADGRRLTQSSSSCSSCSSVPCASSIDLPCLATSGTPAEVTNAGAAATAAQPPALDVSQLECYRSALKARILSDVDGFLDQLLLVPVVPSASPASSTGSITRCSSLSNDMPSPCFPLTPTATPSLPSQRSLDVAQVAATAVMVDVEGLAAPVPPLVPWRRDCSKSSIDVSFGPRHDCAASGRKAQRSQRDDAGGMLCPPPLPPSVGPRPYGRSAADCRPRCPAPPPPPPPPPPHNGGLRAKSKDAAAGWSSAASSGGQVTEPQQSVKGRRVRCCAAHASNVACTAASAAVQELERW